MLSKIVITLGALFLMFVLALAVGLGVWGLGVHSALVQTQAELRAMKANNEKLNSDYSDLTSGSAKTVADLAAAQAQIEALESKLKEKDAENASLTAQLSAIQAKVSFLYAWQFGSEAAFDEKVDSSDDAKLKALWEKAKKTKADADYWNLTDYIVQSVADTVGIKLSPRVTVSNG